MKQNNIFEDLAFNETLNLTCFIEVAQFHLTQQYSSLLSQRSVIADLSKTKQDFLKESKC